MKLRHALSTTLLGMVAMTAQATDTNAIDWATPAEATHFRSTPSYAGTLA